MKTEKIDAKTLKGFVEWLKKENCGCCHFKVCDTETREIDICVGWHNYGDGPKENGYNNWKVCWKIGMQKFNNAMQTDLDIDFDMPYDPVSGEVFDTLEEVICRNTLKEYAKLAAWINRQARAAVKFWIEQEAENEID